MLTIPPPPSPSALIPTPSMQMAQINSAVEFLPNSKGYASYGEAIESNSIDNLLADNHYIRLDTITIKSGDQERVHYIKAYNSAGDVVFIQADRPGGLSIQLSNRTLVKMSEGTSIPRSYRMSAAKCASSEICGIGFQCDGEICTLTRSDDGQLYEGTFITVESPSEKRITPSSSPIAYPIITFSEIEPDNDNAIRRVREATAAIQHNAFERSLEDLKTTRVAAEELARRVSDFTAIYAAVWKAKENEQIRYLELLDIYRSLPKPLPESELTKYKQVVSKLFMLNSTAATLLSFVDQFIKERSLISAEVVKTVDAYYELFLETRRNFDREVSSAIMDATRWGLPMELNAIKSTQLVTGNWGTEVSETPAVQSLRRVIGK